MSNKNATVSVNGTTRLAASHVTAIRIREMSARHGVRMQDFLAALVEWTYNMAESEREGLELYLYPPGHTREHK